jgi:hypothetical protein
VSLLAHLVWPLFTAAVAAVSIGLIGPKRVLRGFAVMAVMSAAFFLGAGYATRAACGWLSAPLLGSRRAAKAREAHAAWVAQLRETARQQRHPDLRPGFIDREGISDGDLYAFTLAMQSIVNEQAWMAKRNKARREGRG